MDGVAAGNPMGDFVWTVVKPDQAVAQLIH